MPVAMGVVHEYLNSTYVLGCTYGRLNTYVVALFEDLVIAGLRDGVAVTSIYESDCRMVVKERVVVEEDGIFTPTTYFISIYVPAVYTAKGDADDGTITGWMVRALNSSGSMMLLPI